MTGTVPASRPDWRTWPNLITLVRLLCIPVFVVLVVQGRPGWAIVVLVALGVTDWADGFVARRFHQESRLGKALDPIADRFSVIAVALALVLVGLLPWVVVLTVAFVDLVVVVLSIAVLRGDDALHVTWVGKARSALLFVGLPALLLSSVHAVDAHAPWVRFVALVFVWLGTVGHVVAGAQYVTGLLRTRSRASTH
jgi:cardiolipin synthase